MRALIPTTLSLLLAVSGAAFAAETAAPLSAGQPAGVKKAQREESNMLVLGVGVAAVAAGIALVASDSDDGPGAVSTSPVTTGTSP